MSFDRWRNPETGTDWVVQKPKRAKARALPSAAEFVLWVIFAGLISFVVACIAAEISMGLTYAHDGDSYISDGG